MGRLIRDATDLLLLVAIFFSASLPFLIFGQSGLS